MTAAQPQQPEPAPGATDGSPERRYRVMVVDDSVVVRSLLRRILESDPEIAVVASAADGAQAVDIVARKAPDVVVLDIEMPVMDGLTALPKLIQAVPGLKVIMASTLTLRNADISLKALAAGASDYISKPEARDDIKGGNFSRDLLAKVKVLAEVSLRARGGKDPARRSARLRPLRLPKADQPLSIRKVSPGRPKILAIGSSTGGPKALFKMLGDLDPKFALPILITQHMPETFTTILAEHIAGVAGRPCREAREGDVVEPGHIYVAPGGQHMTVAREGANATLHLDQEPPENYCRPAVDKMLRSVADCYGAGALTVILTGMGQDGLTGCEQITAAGANVIAQDAASSVVWGMPGVVATAGLACAVLPLADIAPYVCELAAGTRP